jgi:hypothetical protein
MSIITQHEMNAMIQNMPTHLHSHLPLLPRTNPRKQSQMRVQATAQTTSDSGSNGKVTEHRTDKAAAANKGFAIAGTPCFADSLVVNHNFVLRVKFSAIFNDRPIKNIN